MTDGMLATAIRNRMKELEAYKLRAEGAIGELANVLATLEGGSFVADTEANGGTGGTSQPVLSLMEGEVERAGSGEGGGGGSASEGSHSEGNGGTA